MTTETNVAVVTGAARVAWGRPSPKDSTHPDLDRMGQVRAIREIRGKNCEERINHPTQPFGSFP